MKEKTVRIQDYVFSLHSDSATVTAWNKSRATVELPNAVEGLPVCDIAPNAFSGCDNLRDISLPAAMEHLPLPEFKSLRSLEAIRVSPLHEDFSSRDGILYNKEQTVLVDCPPARKKPVTVPDSVRKIERAAFRSCQFLPAVVLPDSVEVIGELAFHGCRQMRVLELPESVRFIGRNALSACGQLRSLHFSAELTEPPVLHGCRSLQSITVTPGNPAISSRNGVLYNADASKLIRCPQGKRGRLALPAETVMIDPYGLSGCCDLTEIRVAEGNPAFCDLDGVLMTAGREKLVCCPAGYAGELMLPAETVHISADAFPVQILPIVMSDADGVKRNLWIEGTSLTAIGVSPENPVFTSENGVLYNKDKTVLMRCPGGFSGALCVPEGVTKIADAAFRGCSELTALTLPQTLGEIGFSAFEGCFQITELTVPAGVGLIAQDALVGCVHLEMLTVEGCDTEIAPLAADCCDRLTIRAPKNSPAARYAKEEGFSFIAL